MNFLHTFSPTPILLQTSALSLRWYGLLMAIAIAAGMFVAIRLAKRYGIERETIYDLSLYLVVASIVGARVYAVLLFPKYYTEHPLEIVQIWKGGLAIHGAILAGIITLWFYAKKKKLSFWLLADILVPALALGQAIGRWGNYFNQELFGKPTSLPWGIPIDPSNRPQGFENFEHFHPVFLYESILNLFIFLLLVFLHWYRIKNKELGIRNPSFAKATAGRHESGKPLTPALSPEGRGGNKTSLAPGGRGIEGEGEELQPGTITLLYLFSYSLVRIFMEQFRLDETPTLFAIRLPILVSLAIITAIFIVFGLRYNKRK